MDIIIVRYGELALKSPAVRRSFQNKLIENIRFMLGKGFKVRAILGRIIITGDAVKASEILVRVFGIVSFSPCIVVKSSLEEIEKFVIGMDFSGIRTFAIRTRRTGSHNFSSNDVNKIIGNAVREKKKLKVDLTDPGMTICIDIRDEEAYIYTEILRGPGGIPVGVEGSVVGMIRNRKDLKASILMMKRGCYISPLFIGLDKIKETAFERELNSYSPRPVKPKSTGRGDFIRYAESLAGEVGSKGLVTGTDNMEDFISIRGKTSLPVYAPLISLYKHNI